MLHKYKLLVTLSFLSLFIISCSSTKLEVPTTEGEELKILYDQAINLVSEKDFIDAAIIFEDIERQYPYSKWAAKSQLMSAYCYYKSQFYDESLNSLDRFISLHPASKDIGYAYYLKSLNYFYQIEDVERDQSMTEIALNSFQNVINKYPDTSFANDAKGKIDILNDRLAAKEMEVARYYQFNKNWISAINRYNTVLDKYKTSIYTAEALHRLVEIYYSLGLISESEKYASTLGYNFPDSEWYKKSYEIVNSNS